MDRPSNSSEDLVSLQALKAGINRPLVSTESPTLREKDDESPKKDYILKLVQSEAAFERLDEKVATFDAESYILKKLDERIKPLQQKT